MSKTRKGKKREERPKADEERPAEEPREPEPPADKVDEAIWESFPASDPPSFTPETTG